MYYEKVKNVKNKIQKQPPRGVPGKRCSVLFFFKKHLWVAASEDNYLK